MAYGRYQPLSRTTVVTANRLIPRADWSNDPLNQGLWFTPSETALRRPIRNFAASRRLVVWPHPSLPLQSFEFIECARSHARSERRIIMTLEFDFFAVLKKILHRGNYGVRAMQAIAGRSSTQQIGLSVSCSFTCVSALR